ncbi:Uncharacterised protein [Burkholderia pseudomallei]|nr:Uncharacterised protein [Burkholderia pseudomallei]
MISKSSLWSTRPTYGDSLGRAERIVATNTPPKQQMPNSRRPSRTIKIKPVHLLLCLAACFAGVSASADELSDYYATLTTFFEKQHLIPVAVPRTEQIGDVFDIKNLTYVANAQTCFPKFVQPPETPTVLPAVAITHSVNAAAALGARALAEGGVSVGDADTVTITYTEATVTTTPAMLLAQDFDRKRCSFLESIVDQKESSPNSPTMSLLVIGEVYKARREVRLVYKNNQTAKLEASGITRLLTALGMQAKVQADRNASNTIVVVSYDKLPIAVRPAFVADRYAGTTLGSGGSDVVEWRRVDIERNPSQGRLIDDISNEIKNEMSFSKFNHIN